MPVTMLDPKTALVIVDLQKGGMSAPPAPNSIEQVVENSSALARTFRHYNQPVVLVHVAGAAPGRREYKGGTMPRGADWTDFVTELNQQPQDHVVTKRTWGAFTNTDLEDYLKRRDVTQVVIAGCATSIGVESTARHAFELGFNVTIAIDAITDVSVDAHVNSVTRIFPRMSESGTTREIVDLLKRIHSLSTSNDGA